MLNSILVPLDGSTFAEHALPAACAIARQAGAMLRLVHVHTLTPTPIYIEGEPVIDQNLVSLSRKHEQLYLTEIEGQLKATDPALRVTTEWLDRSLQSMVNEPLAAFLARHIVNTAPDLVVMTTHGRGGLERAWLGSVADTLVRLSHTPLLLLRPKTDAPDFSQLPTFKHILIPLDGSPLAEQVLTPALMVGDLMQAEYTLLRAVETVINPGYWPRVRMERSDWPLPHATEPHMVEVPPQAAGIAETELVATRAAEVELAKEYVAGIVQQFQTPERQIHSHVVLAESPANAILGAVQKYGCDLVTLATHGRSGVSRLLLGSVADKVLRGATTAVLIYRPQAVQP